MMASLYYYDQNPSGFYFLVQIRAFVIFKPHWGYQIYIWKEKRKEFWS